MRYLVLSADYMKPKVRDVASNDETDPWEVLSPELRSDIARWNDDYQVVVPMDLPRRADVADLIEELDSRGLELASRIAVEVDPSKVRYYSEGLMRYRP